MSTGTDNRELQGARVPVLGLGTWRLAGDDCRRTVEEALSLGYRHLDTAQGYENEASVGAAIRASQVLRNELFLTTKAWPDDLVKDSSCVDKSLERLGVAQVDLLLMHWPSPTLPLEQTLDALVRVKEEGKARHIGVSNFTPSMVQVAAKRAPILCNQVEYHPFLDQSRLRHLAKELGHLLAAYSPLARGDVAKDETLNAIARAHGRTPAQIALRWLLQQEPVVALPKTASPQRLRENLAVFDFVLSDEEMRRISALATGKRYIDPEWGPDWET